MTTSNEPVLDHRVHSHTARRAAQVTFLVLLIAALLVAMAPAASASSKREAKVRTALTVASAQKGDPYRWGAAGPTAFDCSGLVQYSYRRARIVVPRTSSAQAAAAQRVSRRKMRRGDLIFYTGRRGVYHVGMYVGRKRGRPLILHAPRPGQRVRVDRVSTTRWFAGTFRR